MESNSLSKFLSIRERLSSIDKFQSSSPSPSRSSSSRSSSRPQPGRDQGVSSGIKMSTPGRRRKRMVAPLPDLSPPPNTATTNTNTNTNTNTDDSSDANVENQKSHSKSSSSSVERNSKWRNSKTNQNRFISKPKPSPFNNKVRSTKTTSTTSATAAGAASSSTKKKRSNPMQMNIPTRVEFQTVLRMRPMNHAELQQNDSSILVIHQDNSSSRSNNNPTVSLLPLRQTFTTGARSNKLSSAATTISTTNNDTTSLTEYKFDQIIGPASTQSHAYHQIMGRRMAKDAIHTLLLHDNHTEGDQEFNVRNHVVISMGVSNSGKTYTLMGDYNGGDDGRHMNANANVNAGEGEGIVPRLVDDIFHVANEEDFRILLRNAHRNSNANANGSHDSDLDSESNIIQLEVTMVHIHNDKILDMLSCADSSAGGSTSTAASANAVSRMIHNFESTHSQSTNSYKHNHHHPTIVNRLHSNTNTNTNTNTNSHSQLHSLKELKISQDKKTQDFITRPTIKRCSNAIHARKVIYEGMKQNTVSSTKLNQKSSRGHTIITLRPILIMDRCADHDSNVNDEGCRTVTGASITIVDMAGIERTGMNHVNRIAMRESVAINSTNSALLSCLRSIKHNQDRRNVGEKEDGRKGAQVVVPYRQNKLTMLMQPLFSGSSRNANAATCSAMASSTTTVKMLISVYPGTKDYNEKKSLLADIEALRGLSVSVEGRSRRAVQHKKDSSSTGEGFSSFHRDSYSMASPSMSDIGALEDISLRDSNASDVFSQSQRSPGTQIRLSVDCKENISSPSSLHSKTGRSPLNKIVNAVKPFTPSKKRKAEMDALYERIDRLEAENEALRKRDEKNQGEIDKLQGRNEALKTKATKRKNQCVVLGNENKQLKRMLHDAEKRLKNAGIRSLEDKENQRDLEAAAEKDLRESRQWRYRHQNLLGSPLSRHMRAVEVTKTVFTGRVGSNLMVRSPFKLTALMKSRKGTSSSDHEENVDISDGENDLESIDGIGRSSSYSA